MHEKTKQSSMAKEEKEFEWPDWQRKVGQLTWLDQRDRNYLKDWYIQSEKTAGNKI